MADDATAIAQPRAPEDGVILVNDKPYMENAEGVMKPLSMVKTADKLEDEMVRRAFGFAEELSAQVARFRQHTFDDVDGLVELLGQDLGVRRVGGEGNMTFYRYDGLRKIKVSMVKLITFGPLLQQAKKLIDECLTEWASEGRPEIEAIVAGAFNTDQEGKINRAAVLGLRKHAITDPRWLRAMDAIAESERVIGSKRYVNFYRRENQTAKWEHVSIDVASA